MELQDVCSICLNAIGDTNYAMTPCKHKFHLPCYAEWRTKANTCPNCNADQSETVLNRETDAHVRERQQRQISGLVNFTFLCLNFSGSGFGLGFLTAMQFFVVDMIISRTDWNDTFMMGLLTFALVALMFISAHLVTRSYIFYVENRNRLNFTEA